jgi:hypothetical protein
MSVSLSVKGYSDKANPEFQKHLKAVKFCIENDLSFPKETSEFFKGKLGGDSLEDYNRSYILSIIENGIDIPLTFIKYSEFEAQINVADIPKEASTIIIKLV